jgi:manganese/iron transport system permease protein
MEAIMDTLELRWWLGAIVGGAGCGLAGFFLLALDLPFLAVCLAHAALAGAVLGQVAGVSPTLCAFAGALIAAALLGPAADRMRVPAATLSGILFSLSLGLAFLGIGLAGNGRAPAMSLLWGNLLLLDWPRLAAVAAVTLSGVVLSAVFLKEIKAVLFSRTVAWSCGLPASAIVYALIAWCGLAITVNLEAVGGLMLYSLLVNPAAAARQLTDRFSRALVLAGVLAAGSAAGGLLLSLRLDWPAGASIVLVSSAVFAAAALGRGVLRTK